MRLSVSEDALRTAAHLIQAGELVAFPTETVYGLGADAFNAQAVNHIYEMKGRPSDNPLILHVADWKTAKTLAENIPEYASRLATAFWPGPLTLVLRKAASLPSWVGGHPNGHATTLAVRMPSHPAARALIAQSGCIIAAPSANKAGTPSPTCASHVEADFGGEVFILDGGEVSGGLESTVVDVTGESPVILRPGAITAEMIRALSGVKQGETGNETDGLSDPPRSPGMKYRHYAPDAPMAVYVGEPDAVAARIIETVLAECAAKPDMSFGILATAQTVNLYRAKLAHLACFVSPETDEAGHVLPDNPLKHRIVILVTGDRQKPETIAHALYACLRRFNTLNVAYIHAEGVPESGLGQAVMNRMYKAAGGRVIYA